MKQVTQSFAGLYESSLIRMKKYPESLVTTSTFAQLPARDGWVVKLQLPPHHTQKS
jgi:predicted RNA-binding protein YlxR (DUF448 family)